MNYTEFLERINKNYPGNRAEIGPINIEILHAALGLCEEAGEVASLIKKNIFYGQAIDTNKMLGELGDTLHYLTRLAHLLNYSMPTVMDANVSKLDKRFPNGYSNEAAIYKADQK